MPRIIYDSDKTIDLNIGPESLLVESVQNGNINYSGGGKYEAINWYCIDQITLDVRFKEATYRKLYSWWHFWARHRKAFALAMDTGAMVSTTLDAAAAAAQTIIPVTSTTGFTIGDTVQIRSSINLDREIAEVYAISEGISITIDRDLMHSFVSGDILRHANYYPYLICTDESFKPLRTGSWYSITLGMIEAYTDGYLDIDDDLLEL